MKKQLQRVFEFNQIPVRTVIKGDAETWWVAKDVCNVLEIANSRDAVARLDEDEKGVAIIDTLGGPQEMQIINEPGLYSLILTSNKPEAKAFKRWITHEIIPQIRKTGYYKLPAAASIPELVENIYGKKEAKRIRELNETSDQVKIGFAFHDENYMTVKEIVEAYKGIDERNVWAELRLGGYIEPVFCKKGQYGVPYQCYIERLSEKGKEFGQEVWNRRKKSTQPFSFRWRKDKVPEIIRLYLLILERR